MKLQKNLITVKISGISRSMGVPLLDLEFDVPEIITSQKYREVKHKEYFRLVPTNLGFKTVEYRGDGEWKYIIDWYKTGILKYLNKIPEEYKERIFLSMVLFSIINTIENYFNEFDGYQFDSPFTISENSTIKEYIRLISSWIEGCDII